MGVKDREPDAVAETENCTYQIYEDEDKVTITKGKKGDRSHYGVKREFPEK